MPLHHRRLCLRAPSCATLVPNEWPTREEVPVQARVIAFGVLEVEGERYEHDVVIDAGRVRKRRKKPSKQYRDRYGHTPLSAAEELPWGGDSLVIGTGTSGALPVMPDVEREAQRRGITITAVPTREACRLLADLDPSEVRAVLHATC